MSKLKYINSPGLVDDHFLCKNSLTGEHEANSIAMLKCRNIHIIMYCLLEIYKMEVMEGKIRFLKN